MLGLGTDLTSASRIAELIEKFGKKFETRIFTASEILEANKIANPKKRAMFYAKRFAAKEAFSKATGLGIGRGINFLDIEISNDQFGKPFINILNGKEKFLRDFFKTDFVINLSLSDEKSFALATVVISKK